jgi:T5SS/PEP-CTERM-associated repeat protein
MSAPVNNTNTLDLTTSGTNVPLRVRSGLTVANGGFVRIQNGAVQVDGLNSGSLTVEGSLLLSNVAARLATTNATAVVGSSTGGSLTMASGSWLAHDVRIGPAAGTAGTITVAGGLMSLSNDLSVGYLGTGNSLVISNGGQVISEFGYVGAFTGANTNTAVVTGVGSVWSNRQVLVVGLSSRANRLNINDGGLVLAQTGTIGSIAGSGGILTIDGGTNRFFSTLNVGGAANATGTVWLTGGQLATANDDSNIGLSGVGDVTVSNGTWQARRVNLGFNSGARGAINLTGGSLLASNMVLGVNSGAVGTLTVAGGTARLTSVMTLGFSGTGTVWVTGGDLVVTNSSLDVGVFGHGILTVSNGTLRSAGVTLGGTASGRGTFTMVGGTTVVSNSLSIGAAVNGIGAVWMTGGNLITTNATAEIGSVGTSTFNLSNGTWLAREVSVANAGSSRGTFTIAGGTNLVRSTFIVGSLGNATGTVWLTGGQLTVTNDYTSIGSFGTGQMTVSNGNWTALHVFLANAGNGTLTLVGVILA